MIAKSREQEQAIDALSLEHGNARIEMAYNPSQGDIALVEFADGHQVVLAEDGEVILRDLGGPGGRRWLIVEHGQPVAEVHANGRRQALGVVQALAGGEQHATGSFYDVLIGSRLGHLPLRAMTPREHEETFG
jgi:hypothetical protein